MAVRIDRLGATQRQWATVCRERARLLRQHADQASPLQTERATIEYGAAVVLEKAASHWLTRDGEATARIWMKTADDVLEASLVPRPWAPEQAAARDEPESEGSR